MSFNDDVIAEFRAHGGTVGGRFAGTPLLLLHTTGSKTGLPRISPMTFQAADDGGWYVFASYAGAEHNPAWYGNLVADPAVSIEVATDGGVETVPVTAADLTGADRERVWEEQKRVNPGFAEYEAKTARVIPVVSLTRR